MTARAARRKGGTTADHRRFAPGPWSVGFDKREHLRELNGLLTYREYCLIFERCRQAAIRHRSRENAVARRLLAAGCRRSDPNLSAENRRILWRYENRKRFRNPVRAVLPKGIRDPEAQFQRNRWKWDEIPDRRAAYSARRRVREVLTDIGDTRGFYAEVRRAPFIICRYCRRRVVGRRAHVDHMIPLSRGGRHERANLTAACAYCNQQKHDRTAEEYMAIREARTASGDTQYVPAQPILLPPVYAVDNPLEVTL
jgi:5-methylcytosine-specific restriction endonuclease McrA